MKLSFRWYGRNNDPISLDYVRQIPAMEEIVWALHDKQAGVVWSEEEIKDEIAYIESHGLKATIVESVNIHDAIKLGLPARDAYIETYKECLKNLGKNGVKVVCYNFMPIFDWTRTDMFHPLPDGSTSLFFEKEKIMSLDPQELVNMMEKESNGLTLPGWEPERLAHIKDLFTAYDGFTDDKLRENFKYFMDAIIPTCEEYDIKMAIHPDDPPFSIFGLPRLVNTRDNIRKLLAVNPSPYNGLTFCTGSLGSDPNNEVVTMLDEFIDRTHFMHVRNVCVYPNGDFSEVSHRTSDGTVDITGVMNVLAKYNFDGYIRPDHGRHIFGENSTNVRPGYGLYDRAMGAMYLTGNWDMAQRLHQ
ncbi:mannonate dehydratase [Enterococcus sp. CWB-B31]|uniref:mannonate dehydratase n=1 Tax=Enterococcus sp. CWB-B31 TaxID=2885159 RepID=UPI001E287824|nr:mannonate dehydratase [Enterococcus sp. CWB-B31]MCB5955172.1 mannonate dehydratase [Enterococcus sp. CWB-B31]